MSVKCPTVFCFEKRVLHMPNSLPGTNREHHIPFQDMTQAEIVRAIEKQRKALWRTLKRARLEQRLLQVEVAERLGVPQSFVSKYESGKRALDFIEILQVCNALGITLDKFLVLFEIEQANGTSR